MLIIDSPSYLSLYLSIYLSIYLSVIGIRIRYTDLFFLVVYISIYSDAIEYWLVIKAARIRFGSGKKMVINIFLLLHLSPSVNDTLRHGAHPLKAYMEMIKNLKLEAGYIVFLNTCELYTCTTIWYHTAFIGTRQSFSLSPKKPEFDSGRGKAIYLFIYLVTRDSGS